MKKFPSIKKNIKSFLTSEEGKITKKNAAELGVGLAVLGVMLGNSASAHDSCWKGDHSSHASHGSHSSHSSHGSHGSHSSHASHSSHGSHGSHSSHASHSSHSSHGSHGSHSSHSSHGSHGSHSSHSSHGSHGSHSSHSSHSSHGSHGSHSSHSSHGSHASHGSHGSHSSCCPFIILWNGKEYIMENNILPESENQARKNLFVDDFYKLESSPQPQGGKYKLRILEFEQEHSYFSNFELVRAIHPKNLTSAVLDGKMVFYKEPKLPSKIINNQGKNILKAISRGDAFKGSAEDFLSVKFENLTGKENALIWQASLRAGYPRVESIQKALKRLKTEKQIGNFLNKMSSMPWKVAGTCFVAAVGFCHSSCKVSIIFYLHSSSGKKGKKIGMTHPREMPSTGLMKISPKSKTLDIGLEWTNTHKLSALGLAQLASSEEVKKTKVESIALESLSHSQKKEITKKDLIKGGVELKPVQHIELDFPYKKITLKSGETVSYFLKSKGYYKKV